MIVDSIRRLSAATVTSRTREPKATAPKVNSLVDRARLLSEANSLPTYRARQRRRAELGVGTLADYAWFGSKEDWERAKALAKAGDEALI